ncbi:sugar phosphate isomerase/epimerase family protein [Sphingopyxis fribergensis]
MSVQYSGPLGREHQLGRRTILAGGLAALAAACAPQGPRRFFAPSGPPIGVQLYSVAKELSEDLDGTLAAIAAIGYRTVELAGYAGKTPAELRAALDRAGLRCTSAHVPAKSFRPAPRTLDDDLDILAAEARILGFDTVIMPLFVTPPHLPMKLDPGEDVRKMVSGVTARMTEADWRWTADYMNDKGAKLKARGLRFGFHNHSNEFIPLGEGTAMDFLVANTDPALVSFQLDCGWAVAAGVDPADFIRRHKGRVSALHVKDVAATNKPNVLLQMDPAEIGRGVTDWPKLLAAAHAAGIDRFFVEQEAPYVRPALDSLRDNFTYLAGVAA